MFSVLLQFIPLALAAITPTMVIFVTVMLAAENGLVRSLAVVTGRFSAHLLIAIAFVYLAAQIPDHAELFGTETDTLPMIFLVAGIVLLILAAAILIRGKEPGESPSRLGKFLNSVRPVTLFFADFVIVFFSIRLLTLVVAGAAIIQDADLHKSETLICVVLLAALMVWPMLVPLGVYFGMGERRDETLESMRDWLISNQVAINAAVLALFGGALVVKGYSGL